MAGGTQGSLFFFHNDRKDGVESENFVGKHTAAICAATWSDSKLNLLLVGGSDCAITLLSKEGQTLKHLKTTLIPSTLSFVPGLIRQTSKMPWNVGANLKGEKLLLYSEKNPNIEMQSHCSELHFKEKYGRLINYFFSTYDTVIVVFNTGYILIIALGIDNLGEELSCVNHTTNGIKNAFFTRDLNQVILFTISSILLLKVDTTKVLKQDELSLTVKQTQSSYGSRMSSDSQFFSFMTQNSVEVFLCKIPSLTANFYDSHKCKLAFVSALRELTIIEIPEAKISKPSSNNAKYHTLELRCEPTAICLNDKVLLTAIRREVQLYLQQTGYVTRWELPFSKILSFQINVSGGILLWTEKTLFLCQLNEKNDFTDKRPFIELNQINATNLMSTEINSYFVVLCYKQGNVEVVSLSSHNVIRRLSYVHQCEIKKVSSNLNTTRLLLWDNDANIHLVNLCTKKEHRIDINFARMETFYWDVVNNNIFHIYNGLEIYSYIIQSTGKPVAIKMPGHTDKESVTDIPQNFQPQIAHNGSLICFLPGANHITTLQIIQKESIVLTPEKIFDEIVYKKALAAFSEEKYEVAIQAFHNIGLPLLSYFVSIVSNMKTVKEKAQYVALVLRKLSNFCNQQNANTSLLNLKILKALKMYASAIVVAKSLGYDCSSIQLEQALKHFNSGEFTKAIALYRSLLDTLPHDKKILVVEKLCLCYTYNGQFNDALKQLQNSNNQKLFCQCADIALKTSSTTEAKRVASKLYMQSGDVEKAFSLLLEINELDEAAKLAAKINNPNLLGKFALMKEENQEFETALQFYIHAGDADNAIRLNLEVLGKPHQAYDLARSSNSSKSFHKCAEYAKSINDFIAAVEFLVLSKNGVEALELAILHDEQFATIKTLESVLLRNLKDEKCAIAAVKLAEYFESKNNILKAARWYDNSEQYHKAVCLYLDGGEPEAIERAIDIVGKLQNDILTHTVIDYLMGTNINSKRQDPIYIFRLYLALNNPIEAAKTAVLLVTQALNEEHVDKAHGIIHKVVIEFVKKQQPIDQDCYSKYTILHSYILAKKCLGNGNEIGASLLLIRVSRNLNLFTKQTSAKILSSTILVAYKAGLRMKSHQLAIELLKSDLKENIQEKHRKKISNIVRKKPGNDSFKTATYFSPYANVQVDEFCLQCPVTKLQIPMCYLSGKGISKSDCCVHPDSLMLARYSECTKTALAGAKKLTPSEALDKIKQVIKTS